MTTLDKEKGIILGIIAGEGHLPLLIAEECQRQGIPYHVFPLHNQVNENEIAPHPHTFIYWGQVARTLDLFRAHHINTLVMAGGVKRPSFFDLKMDATAMKWLSHIGKKAFGDDGLLSGLVDLLTKEGFKIIGSQDILPRSKTKAGVLGQHPPSALDLEDIAKGIQVAHTLGQLDVGQAAIIENGVVLGVEGVEGTAALIARCGYLKLQKQGGVLVKACKPQQSQYVDLPTIGPDTIDQIAASRFQGVALEAQKSLILFPETVMKKANQAGIFIYGF